MIYDANKNTFAFNNLSKFSALKHFISTRKNGFSNFGGNDLNISFETNDTKENVLKNRKLLSEKVQIPLENFVMQNQVHGNKVVKVNNTHKGKGIFSHSDVIGDNDAMITNSKNLCLFAFAADCVPILFYDSENHVCGIAHSGWQGTVKKIAEKTVTSLKNEFNTNPKNLIVGIAPSISVKNYEVGQNVTEAVLKSFGTLENYTIYNSETKKYHFDLWYTNKQILLAAGVLEENIEISQLCTFENTDLFFSARKDEPTGRFGAGIMLQ